MKTLRLCALIHPLRYVSMTLAIMALLSVSHLTLAHETETVSKVYPGAFCAGGQGVVCLDFGDECLVYDERGAILNTQLGDSADTVICSVVRDEAVGTAGIKRAFVHYEKGTEEEKGTTDSEGRNAFSCTLYSRDPFGNEVDSETQTDTGPAGKKTFSFGALKASSDQKLPGYYHFVCNIPRLTGADVEVPSAIISYQVDEIRTSQDKK